MDNLNYILFLCVFAPLLLALAVIDKKARPYTLFILIGIYICFAVSGINSFVLNLLGGDMQYVTTTVTPIIEEIMKALPLLIYAFLFKCKREKLISLGYLVGIGFAIMENLVILIGSINGVSLFWALIRGFASASLHGVTTAIVAYGISFVRQKKKLFVTGVFSLLTTAVIIHAIYNCLVQSQYQWLGYVVPLIIYLGIIVAKVLQKDSSTAPKPTEEQTE